MVKFALHYTPNAILSFVFTQMKTYMFNLIVQGIYFDNRILVR